MHRVATRLSFPMSFVLAILGLGAAAFPASARAQADDGRPPAEEERGNVVSRIAPMNGVVEFEVYSTREFPMRAMPAVLRIGTREFSLSRYPDPGSLNRLIFLVPSEEFAELRASDEVSLYYGTPQAEGKGDGAGLRAMERPRGHVWNFGTLQPGASDEGKGAPKEQR